jgi:hypothetical protein
MVDGQRGAKMFGSKRKKIEKLDFILAGAQKSGTTALHYFLAKHPRITMGDQQEMHFFDDEEIFSGPVDYELLHRHYPPASPSIIAGECTPSYLYWPAAAERIWNYNPQIKLLVLLRNPVDRAFAHWNMQRFKGREPLDFLDAVKQEKARITGAPPLEARRFAYVARGFYAQQLERFFSFFSPEQLKAVKFEEFNERQPETLSSIFLFLGVEPPRMVRSKDRNVVPYEREMNWQERVFVYNLFAQDIANLERLLGWNCADWKL